MKTHLLCMGLGYWLVTKVSKDIVREDNLEICTEEQREVFMCNIREREAILSALLESEYSQLNFFKTCITNSPPPLNYIVFLTIGIRALVLEGKV